MCNGAPVANAFVFFEPIKTGDSAVTGKQGMGMTDENGEFSISTYGTEDGAVVGKHRVRVGAPEKMNFTCDCETNSELDLMEVDITSSGENSFVLDLPKKKPGRGRNSGYDDEEEEDD